VSTAIVGLLYNTERITLAVFLPTPGKDSNSAELFGIFPLCFVVIFFAKPIRCLDLLFG
ncbi:uncharacterized protein METZ01_LOCUS13824, partial [marine metagenome]